MLPITPALGSPVLCMAVVNDGGSVSEDCGATWGTAPDGDGAAGGGAVGSAGPAMMRPGAVVGAKAAAERSPSLRISGLGAGLDSTRTAGLGSTRGELPCAAGERVSRGATAVLDAG